MTVGKSRPHHLDTLEDGLCSLATAEDDLDCVLSLQLDCQDLDCVLSLQLDDRNGRDLVCLLLLSLLLRKIWTVFSRYC